MHLFAVLGDPVRFRIVEILASGSHISGEVIDAVVGDFHISRAAVSHHLRILRDEGVVVVQSDENQRIYRLTWDVLERIDRVVLDLYEKWDRRDGWPYQTDPLASPPRRHRLAERARHPLENWQGDVEPLAPPDYSDELPEEEEEGDDDEMPG